MKYIYLFLGGLLSLVPLLTNAQPLSEEAGVNKDEKGVLTNPAIAYPEFKYTKDQEYKQYLEDPSYNSTKKSSDRTG